MDGALGRCEAVEGGPLLGERTGWEGGGGGGAVSGGAPALGTECPTLSM